MHFKSENGRNKKWKQSHANKKTCNPDEYSEIVTN